MRKSKTTYIIIQKTIVFVLLLLAVFPWVLFSGFSYEVPMEKKIEKLSKELRKTLQPELTERERNIYASDHKCGEAYCAETAENDCRLLYNIDEEPEFLLVSSASEGYAVYSRLTGALLERNYTATSPFPKNEKAYYLGPTYYFTKTDAGLKNTVTEETVSSEYFDSIRASQEKIRRNVITKAYERGQFSAKATPEFEFNTGLPFSVNLLEFATTVPFYGTIIHWASENRIGVNTMGTCQLIATDILLRYEDAIYGGVIPQSAPSAWSTLTNNKIYTYRGYNSLSELDLLTGQFTLPSQVSKYEDLHRYLIAKTGITVFASINQSGEIEQRGISNDETISVISSYLSEVTAKGCLTMTVHSLSYTANTINSIFPQTCSAIDNGHPVAVSISWKSEELTPSGDPTSSGNLYENHHKVVAYGYYNDIIQNEKYLLTHFGWGSSGYPNKYSCVFLNAAYFLEPTTNYYLSTTVNVNRHILSCSGDEQTHSCDNVDCYANGATHEYSIYMNDLQHKCICGYIKTHYDSPTTDTDYFLYLPYMNSRHLCYCSNMVLHPIKTDEVNHFCEHCSLYENHTFLKQSNNISHKCSFCSRVENCTEQYLVGSSQPFSAGDIREYKHMGKCGKCGEGSFFEHSGTNGSSGVTYVDVSLHNVNCVHCGLNDNFAHSYDQITTYDATQHKKYCRCSEANAFIYENHDFKTYLLFWKKCKICGYIK